MSALTREEQKELAPIIEELISPRNSSDDLVELWLNSPADMWFRDGEEIRVLLKRAREKIG